MPSSPSLLLMITLAAFTIYDQEAFIQRILRFPLIPKAPNRYDVLRVGRFILHLHPQAADIHIHNFFLSKVRVTPNMIPSAVSALKQFP